MAIYDDYMDKASPGMKADSGNDRVETFAANADIPFGVVVGDDTAGVKAGGTGTLRGISLMSDALLNDKYVKGDAVSTMTRGLVWATVSAQTGAGVTEDGAVYYDADGLVSNEVTTVVPTALTNAVFRSAKITTTNYGDVALVELAHPFA